MNRLHQIGSNISSPDPSREDDVVICCALRSPITKSNKGVLKDACPEEILVPVLKEVLNRTKIDPGVIDDICIGCALQPGAGALSSRIAQLLSGIPHQTSLSSVNRQCSSGLQAVANIAASIKAGYIDVGIGGGVESMTMFDMTSTLSPENISELVFNNDGARNCLLPMGTTSENIVEMYNLQREDLDKFSYESHRKASMAQSQGLYDEEIVPIKVPKTGVIASRDDGIRSTATMQSLAKLKPSFKEGGLTTAGNSSQVSDGAAAVLLARRSVAKKLNLPMLAIFKAFKVAGVPPEIMGIGPIYAIPKVLESSNLTIDDIDVIELNEAFASQSLVCCRELKIPSRKLNPKGGAIALGHPLGCTGARQIATLLPEMRRQKAKYGLVSMCVGSGMGAAAVIENLVL